MSSPESVLRAMDIDLDDVPTPQASYVPARRVGDLIYTSGMGTNRGGVRHHTGVVGEEISVEEGREAARLAAINCLLAARSLLRDLDEIEGVVQLVGYVRSGAGFTEQHLVVEGASQLMLDVFGEQGRHARVSVGVAELPLELSVEVQTILHVRPSADQAEG